ncbi:MAG: hypothetical protein U1F68_01185 [Gammaproteobacteria bacterium]
MIDQFILPSDLKKPEFFLSEFNPISPKDTIVNPISPKDTIVTVRPQPRVILRSVSPLPEGNFTIRQSWEGRIISVDENDFTAIISDRTNYNNPDEEVVIEREELSKDDHELLKPGAVFYWSIGYKDAPGEPRQRVSQIRFRRLPAWSQREIDQASLLASEFAHIFVD